MSKNYKIIIIGIILLFLLNTAYQRGVHSVTPVAEQASNQSVYQMVDEARLGVDEEKVKLLVIDTKGGLGKVFLFQNNDDSIATSLFTENPNIESPSFRIVKGQDRDWLVVTTIGNSGTGYLKHIDTWYVANPYYQGNPAIFSYPSDSHTYDIDGTLKQKLTTEASISADDKAIEIKFILETCETQDKCAKTTKAAQYVWSSEKDFFVLDEEKSEISALEISSL